MLYRGTEITRSTGVFGYSGRWVNEHGPTFGNRYQNDLKVRKYSDPKQSNN
jgi:hypothetical protein